VRAILMYHSIDDSGSVLAVPPRAFRSQLDWIAGRGITVVPVEELIGLPAAADAVALTFDDGFDTFAAEAWPLLGARGLPVTLFVATDYVGGANAWERGGARAPRRPLLGWDALRRLGAEGVRLGAHSASHPRLTRLQPARLAHELTAPVHRIREETGQTARVLAYPYGDYDGAVIAAARREFALACTTDFRPLDPADDPHALPRLDMWYFRTPGALDGWGSAAFHRQLRLRHGLRRARRMLTGGVGS
jgi:peptidoglycan/xylan/chitin deacetylase (PgdA/CDA1 family)